MINSFAVKVLNQVWYKLNHLEDTELSRSMATIAY
jgi:hypothetical protein